MYPWDGKNVYFIGFMATGKSRVGQEFARLLGRPFIDSDDLIEERAGMSISDIFSREGEPAFRQLEIKIVREISKKKNQVVALGGGAVIDEKNWQKISDSGLTICLTAPADLLYDRISRKTHRPLMASSSSAELLAKIKNLFAQREPYYTRADYCFKSSSALSPRKLAAKIYEQLLDEV
ncbi:MAG: shikimate kinase [Calditrichaeota bacterium]|nr:shikimate kinase [Calditrichota bacterium]